MPQTVTTLLTFSITILVLINILEGPSNGFEMTHFFKESLQAVDHVGNPVLTNGDVIVMDNNCSFHQRVFIENQLRLMLRNHGVELIFKSPYSPELNSCQFCFRSMKAYLRQHEQFQLTHNNYYNMKNHLLRQQIEI